MAKIRVYELARELNMQNKVLVERLIEMNVPVKSHMSSLDEDVVVQIKANLLGPTQDTVEVTRIKPTVIRRRRKVVKPPPIVIEPTPKPEEVEAGEETEVVEAEEAAEAAAAETEAQAAVETVEKAAVEAVAPVEAEPEATAEPAPEAPAEVEEAQAAQPETTDTASTAPANEAQPEEIAAPPEAPSPPPKVKKKLKKEAPAKIIKLPERPVEKPAQEAPAAKDAARIIAKPVMSEAPPAPADIEAEEDAQDKKRKKGKAKKRVAAEEARVLKKKVPFRRKEIVEGADLYDVPLKMRKGRKMAKGRSPAAQKTQITTPKAIKRRIKIDETIALSDLAKRMGIKANEMIAKLMTMGVMATVNQTIDFDTAALIAAEFDYELEKAAFEEEALLQAESDDPAALAERPPVVTIMGHVDHGKTSLLDVIRQTHITEMEAGGITQHIGAYHVSTAKGQIVFLDTPGHEAFTAMRARGASVTDIVVLVVAADDGVMPQTIEAINHSKAAGVPIIVAVNKFDKNNANPERVYRELSEQGLQAEEWGGDTIFTKVSAKKKIGIDELLEMILLQSEVLELKSNPDKLARGRVIEAKMDAGRGPVATVLVQEGSLKTGDPVVCGIYHGKVRAMLNDLGTQVESAGPSMPVEILGLTGVPNAGDEFIALTDEKNAKQISEHRMQKQRSKDLAKTSRLSLDKLYERMQQGEVKELNLIIRADVHGSIEALKDSLVKLSNEEVNVNIVHAATGTITESDVSLATVSDAIIIGFNVRPSAKVQEMAQDEGVDMRFHNIIYNVIKEVKDAMVGMMASTFEERVLGRAEVRDVFQVPRVGAIAGCYVNDGKFERGQLVRVLRDGIVSYEGKIGSLRRFKDDVKEVATGYECGVGIENFNDVKIGDVLECYYLEEIRPKIG